MFLFLVFLSTLITGCQLSSSTNEGIESNTSANRNQAQTKPIPENLRFTKDHIWIRVEKDIATIGISDFEQRRLGEVLELELPKVGEQLNAGEGLAIVDAGNNVFEVMSPISGVVTEVNSPLADDPTDINADPYDKGWFVRMRTQDDKTLKRLMSLTEYDHYIRELSK